MEKETEMIYGKEWDKLSMNACCTRCGHTKREHSLFESSLGNPSHVCEKIIKVKGIKYGCLCDGFEY